MLLDFIKRSNIKLLCIDFDKTLVSVQTHGRWTETAEELAIYVRPEFKKLIKYAFNNQIYVSIVTYSSQVKLVKKCLELNFPILYKDIIVRGTNQRYNINSQLLNNLGIINTSRKNKMIASVILEIKYKYNIKINLNNIILIDDDYANQIIGVLLYLDQEDSTRPIYMYINCPGGSVIAGLAIYDVMKLIRSEVVTINIGMSASMASFLLAAGKPGKRLALPHSRVMIHQPMGGAQGQAEDIRVEANQILRIKDNLVAMYSLMTGRTKEQIIEDLDRDNYLSAEEAPGHSGRHEGAWAALCLPHEC